MRPKANIYFINIKITRWHIQQLDNERLAYCVNFFNFENSIFCIEQNLTKSPNLIEETDDTKPVKAYLDRCFLICKFTDSLTLIRIEQIPFKSRFFLNHFGPKWRFSRWKTVIFFGFSMKFCQTIWCRFIFLGLISTLKSGVKVDRWRFCRFN